MTKALIVVEALPGDDSIQMYEFGIHETMAKLCPDISYKFAKKEQLGGGRLTEEIQKVAQRAISTIEDGPQSHCLYVVPCQLTIDTQQSDEESERSLIVAVAGAGCDKDRCIALNVITFSYEPTPEDRQAHLEQAIEQAREKLVQNPLSNEQQNMAQRLTDIAFFGYISAMQMAAPSAEARPPAN